MALRIVFAGSPAAAVPSLETLAVSQHEVVAVITRADAPLGRKRIPSPTPVAVLADELGIPVLKANRLAPLADDIRDLEPDLGAVVAYGSLIRAPILQTPRLGWINLHFSLLPRWRGAAPVQHAIIAGDTMTGATVFRLVDELDAGPVFARTEQPIGRRETAGHLLGVLAETGADLLRRVVDQLADGTAAASDQVGEPSYAPKLTLEDGRIDFARGSAELDARIRGTTPEPGAFAEVDGERLKILDAAIAHGDAPLRVGEFGLRGGRLLVGTSTDPLHLVTVLPAGRRAMPGADWWRGRNR